MRLVKFLNEPYPYYLGKQSVWRLTLIVFFFTFLFYFLLQPFKINRSEHIYNFFWTSGFHAIVPAAAMIVLGYLITTFFDLEKIWTVKHEFVFFSFFLLIVGIGQFLIRDLIYINHENWSTKYLVEEIRNTFLVGGIFVCIAIPWNLNHLKNQNQKRAARLDVHRVRPESSKVLQIKTKVKSETFDLRLEKFVFACAEGNYLNIVVKEREKVSRLLKRLSIRELMDQIPEQNNVHQTHRSYIVNFDHIDRIFGNAAGYKITFDRVEEYALVSRSRIPIFEENLNLLSSNDPH